MNLSKKPFIKQYYRLQWEEVQNRFVLLYPEGVIQLNDTAGLILNLCDQKNTVQMIIDKLTEEYEVDSIESDVLSFLEEAEKSKWIEYE